MRNAVEDEGALIITECKLSDLEETTFKLFDENLTITSYEIRDPDKEDALIIVDGLRVVIPDAGLSLRAADYCVYDEDEEAFFPDFSIYLVYEENETDPDKYLYWKQDAAQVVLYNHLFGKGIAMDEIEELNCRIQIETED